MNVRKLRWRWRNRRNRLLEIRWFWQRGRRGWSIKDTWSFDLYICGVLSSGVAWLAEHDHGYPGVEPWETPEKWKAYLEDLAFRLAAWNKDTFLDTDAFEMSSRAVEEFGRNLGHFWD